MPRAVNTVQCVERTLKWAHFKINANALHITCGFVWFRVDYSVILYLASYCSIFMFAFFTESFISLAYFLCLRFFWKLRMGLNWKEFHDVCWYWLNGIILTRESTVNTVLSRFKSSFVGQKALFWQEIVILLRFFFLISPKSESNYVSFKTTPSFLAQFV